MNTEIFRPPPDLSISQWADNYRYLSPESSPEPGKWKTSRAPYQRSMMDAVKSSERVVIMTAAQVGKSELLLNVLGYFIQYEPCPILMLQPTLEMGEAFSKDRLAPMIRDSPSLTSLFPNPKSRNTGNTLLHKKFPGGQITIAGANSPAGLASRPIRVLLCDEVDRYPVSAGTEGDPLSLAMKRTANFWNRRIVWVSTPTMKGASRIDEAFSLSSRDEWYVNCPVCGEPQVYSWDNLVYEERTEPVMRCRSCGHESGEYEWKSSYAFWHSNAVSDIRGFRINAFASPWMTWPEIVSSYREALSGGDEQVKVWTNTVLGETYENLEGTIELTSLAGNREDYDAQVPDDVLVLTCGVDTQDNRLELEVVGWGLGNQSWGIEYKVLYGETINPEVWGMLDEYLQTPFRKKDGTELMIACTCIDSAGHSTDAVYDFCRKRLARRVFPIVGRGQWGLPSVKRPTRSNKGNIPLFTLGVSTIKGNLFTRLRAERGEPGYCHFPTEKRAGYDDVYFAGLLSERMTIERKNGRDVVKWETRTSHTRNEPLDCRVYAMGAFEILAPDMNRYAGVRKEHSPVMKESVRPKVKARPRFMMKRGIEL